jgi:3-hydroxyacyl-[acyl-carrier-protein] dehydratase
VFDIQEIMRYVPHRYPFLLIDRVVDFKENEHVRVLKNVSINEAHFQGHFPARPVLPGVYILENMAQAACFLLAKSAGGIDRNAVYVLGKVVKASFLSLVVPGDQLITTIDVEKKLGDMALVSAKSTVQEKVAAKAELMFSAIRE